MNMILTSDEVLEGKNNSYKDYPTCEVLMSTYNGEKYLERQINSIINQVGVKIKLVIRDDGSNDNTLNIIYRYKEKYPDDIEVIQGSNIGIHKSFRELINYNHNYEFIAFADQDDLWDRDKLLIATSTLRHYSSSFYSCASRLIDEYDHELGITTSNSPKYEYYMCGNSKVLTPGAQGCTMVIRKDLLDFIVYKGIPDDCGHDTWIPIVAYLISNCVYDPLTHMGYRQHNSSWTGNREKRIKQFIKNCNNFREGLKRYKPIALDIINKYSDFIKPDELSVIKSISGNEMDFFERKKAISKYKFGKYGWKENLFYKLYYLTKG